MNSILDWFYGLFGEEPQGANRQSTFMWHKHPTEARNEEFSHNSGAVTPMQFAQPHTTRNSNFQLYLAGGAYRGGY